METLSPYVLAAVFLAAAVVVWLAGTRLSRYVSAFADAIGLSGAAAGMLILGVITSLPEVATSGTAAYRGDAQLAGGDILGSVALQLVVLAIADAAIGKGALSSTLPSPALLLQGAMGAILLILVAAAAVIGDIAVLGVGVWTVVLALTYVATPFLARAADKRTDPVARAALQELEERRRQGGDEGGDDSPKKLAVKIAIAGGFILCAGYALAMSGAALAEATGLGSSFFGQVFLAGATSLPELSSALAAARLNRGDLAAGDILGSNMVNIAMLLFVDAIYDGPPVLNEIGTFGAVGALLAAVLTLIFLIGLIERRDKSFLRMGYDSIAILLVYGAGLVFLYRLSTEGGG